MTEIDRVLWLLLDGKWHTLDKVSEVLQIDVEKLAKIAIFLEEFSFIEFNAPRIRITTETKKLLEKIAGSN